MISEKLLPLLLASLATGLPPLETTISHISTDQRANLGETVQLDCTVNNGGDHPVLWLKVSSYNSDDPLIISNGSSIVIDDERYSVTADTANSTYHLKINEIQETNEGLYQCQVIISPSHRISREVKLQIYKPPVIFDNSSSTLISMEGQLVILECFASGVPPPQISWRREHKIPLPSGDVIHRGNLLEIGNITKEDRGVYYCVADNGVGKPRRRRVELEIEFPPIVIVSSPRVGQALEYNADLECNVEAYPDSHIYWIRNSTILQETRKYTIAYFSTRGGIAASVLRIAEVQPNDYGTYVCRCGNKMGESSAAVELFETQDPVCPPACGAQPVMTITATTDSSIQGKL